MNTEHSFFHLLDEIEEFGAIKSPDFIAYIMPLLSKVKLLHEQNLTAHITGIDQVSYTQNLELSSTGKPLKQAENTLFEKPISRGALEVVEHYQEVVNTGETNHSEYSNLSVQNEKESTLKRPIFLLNYKSWEMEMGHCDPLTDIFILGQILASVAFGLDFRKKEDLEAFVNNRNRLYFLNKHLHPTLLNVIFEMTHLYREDRTSNLEEVITKLNNYREYNPENYIDLTQADGFKNIDVTERSSWILTKLKNRLFDISRRNKLLYFRENASFMNLTIASFPILMDHTNVRENDLIFWNESLQHKLSKSKQVNLNTYLEFNSNSFLAPTLNKIRLDARKSKNEYGFSPLKLVVAFLHWYNFKENADEKITSPLLLLSADLVKKKAVTDIYTLGFENLEAEINPILSNYLKDLYNIQLPDFIYLEENAIENLIESIQNQIAQGATGIKLEWPKKPRIHLIHKIARKNFHLKNRKLNKRSSALNLRSFNYSYEQEDFKPLGLQIFNERIRPKNSELEYIINEDILPSSSATTEKERTFYSNDSQGEINPLVWEIDTCNVTLGNFNYRKMSLVKDYNDIILSENSNSIFEKLFDENPKTLTVEDNESFAFESNYPIISADPTQTASILFARTGANYIIQGPPGTGKSQTITNLIADYIARGKKILFVCEKRAALDVVFHRLKNRKLDELCCLIHDSQTDKKSFIQNLKTTYEDFIETLLDGDKITEERNQIIEQLNAEIQSLQYFHRIMQEGEVAPLELLQVLHETKKDNTFPEPNERIYFPKYSEWKENREWIGEWINQLKTNKLSPIISQYPFVQLSPKIQILPNPKAVILEKTSVCFPYLDQIAEFIDTHDCSEKTTIATWNTEIQLAHKLKGILDADMLQLFEENSTEAKELDSYNKDILLKKEELKTKEKENTNWTNKLNNTDAKEAEKQWVKFEKSIFRFISPKYYAFKKNIKKWYDFDSHQVKPSIGSVLGKLNSEYESKNQLTELTRSAEKNFGLPEFENGYNWVKSIHQKPDSILTDWVNNGKSQYVNSLANISESFGKLIETATPLFGELQAVSISELETKLNTAQETIHSLSAFMPYLEKLETISPELQELLYSKHWNGNDFEFNLAYKSLSDIYEKERPFSELNEDNLRINIQRINKLLSKYYDSNVESIREKIRSQFLDKIRVSESPAKFLTEEEKEAKKGYKAGRRILENEFGKSMRYKSIRDLASGESNTILTSIKPVWLMSPLSVSDTMPLDSSLFDVVIYDEASQITVEEGVPALFRTKQTIIVGDEMQMPPTNFFSSNTIDDEEDEAEEKIGISLDADSLLNQGARKLSSVMLGWHYRSRRESLISFSNAAFYQRNLLTIPDSQTHLKETKEFAPVTDIYAEIDLVGILNKSISFQYIENAVYENRKNQDEANYIAHLVSKMLKDKIGKSIGIVAFSMSQQGEIESALERLAAKDDEFETLLEEEYQRVEEDSFNGLFVKNLENVQGDERDIIIMSVCYGSNANGRMLMNFGPINRKGGEKRLNVIFSRAKQNMVVVSSIMPQEIKNDYNVGANYFKKFLGYAKHISEGKLNEANTILDGLYQYQEEVNHTTSALITQVKSEIEKMGYLVDLNVGQSHFKCNIAVKSEQDKTYKLGILLDTPLHYSNENVLEQYCQKPSILIAFGWETLHIYSKDWLENRERVLEKITQKLEGEFEEIEIEIPILIQEKNPETKPKMDKVEEPTKEKPVDESSSSKFERYEYNEGNSNKYWQIAVKEKLVIVEYGRIGNAPQSNTKEFESSEQALNESKKMSAKKVAKGYNKVD